MNAPPKRSREDRDLGELRGVSLTDLMASISQN
jgi:hypothetical protein